jgi:hypothetical protein
MIITAYSYLVRRQPTRSGEMHTEVPAFYPKTNLTSFSAFPQLGLPGVVPSLLPEGPGRKRSVPSNHALAN